MTPTDLRAWQAHMGLSLTTGADALGIDRRNFARLLSGEAGIDRRTELACAAVAAGLTGWDAAKQRPTKKPAQKAPQSS